MFKIDEPSNLGKNAPDKRKGEWGRIWKALELRNFAEVYLNRSNEQLRPDHFTKYCSRTFQPTLLSESWLQSLQLASYFQKYDYKRMEVLVGQAAESATYFFEKSGYVLESPGSSAG